MDVSNVSDEGISVYSSFTNELFGISPKISDRIQYECLASLSGMRLGIATSKTSRPVVKYADN